MTHYTLNTGDSRESPLAEIGPGILPALSPLLQTGEHPVPGFPAHVCRVTVESTALLVSVVRRPSSVASPLVPLVLFAVAPDMAAADRLWPEIDRQYLMISDLPGINAADFAAPERPASVPWCAAIVILPTPEEALWLADFERCLAWAWIENRRKAARGR